MGDINNYGDQEVVINDSNGVAFGTTENPFRSDVQFTLSESGSVTATGNLVSRDVSAYSWITFQLSGGVGTVTFEGSNDNATWFAIPFWYATATGRDDAAGYSSHTLSSNGVLYTGALTTKYLRLRCSAYTSGTIAAEVLYRKLPTGDNGNGTVVHGQNVDTATFTSGSSRVHPMGAVTFNNPATIGSNDVGAVGMTTYRALWVNLRDGDNDAVVRDEDAAASSGQPGIPFLAVRNDAGTDRTNADGDYTWLATDAAGRVGITDLGGSVTVDGTVSSKIVTPNGDSAMDEANDALRVNVVAGSTNTPPSQVESFTGSTAVDGTWTTCAPTGGRTVRYWAFQNRGSLDAIEVGFGAQAAHLTINPGGSFTQSYNGTVYVRTSAGAARSVNFDLVAFED